MFLQRQFLSRIAAWHWRTLHSCSSRVTNSVLGEDLTLRVPATLVKSIGAVLTCNSPADFTISLLQKSFSPLLGRSNVFNAAVYCCNPSIKVSLPGITLPEQRIQELVFPFHSPNVHTSTGYQQPHELTVGDDVSDIPSVAFSSILKKRHKKMNKHKYRKRRQRDVFKRRHLENLKIRKKRAKEKREERRKEREARG